MLLQYPDCLDMVAVDPEATRTMSNACMCTPLVINSRLYGSVATL